MNNLTFEEWLRTRDEELYEGIFDTVKKYGRNAAIAGGLMGAGAMGMNAYNNTNSIPSSSWTSPDAGQYLQNNDDNWTSPDAGQYLGQQQKPQSKFDQAFGAAKKRSLELKQKADQMRKAGRTNATFVHGEMQ